MILAGGYGTRLRPCTYYLNKHMWPIFDHPLIEHAVETLTYAGITQIAVILGGAHPKQVQSYLGDGARYGAEFTYIWQGAPKGIAHAVNCVRKFCGQEKFIVHLADNILEDDISSWVGEFDQGYDCMVLLKEVKDPRGYGVAEVKDGRLVGLEEKPKQPKSRLAVIGVYGFDPYCFKLFDELAPSWRGEYEVTDLISGYISGGKRILAKTLPGRWLDCGTPEDLLEAANFIQWKVKAREERP